MDWSFAILLDFIGPRKDTIHEFWMNLEIHIGEFCEKIGQYLNGFKPFALLVSIML